MIEKLKNMLMKYFLGLNLPYCDRAKSLACPQEVYKSRREACSQERNCAYIQWLLKNLCAIGFNQLLKVHRVRVYKSMYEDVKFVKMETCSTNGCNTQTVSTSSVTPIEIIIFNWESSIVLRVYKLTVRSHYAVVRRGWYRRHLAWPKWPVAAWCVCGQAWKWDDCTFCLW